MMAATPEIRSQDMLDKAINCTVAAFTGDPAVLDVPVDNTPKFYAEDVSCDDGTCGYV